MKYNLSSKIRFLSQASHISGVPIREYTEHSLYFRKFCRSNLLRILVFLASFQIPLENIICPLKLFFSANEHHITRLLHFQKNTAAAKSLQSCPTLCDPIDGSPPGSPVLGFSRQENWSGVPLPSFFFSFNDQFPIDAMCLCLEEEQSLCGKHLQVLSL